MREALRAIEAELRELRGKRAAAEREWDAAEERLRKAKAVLLGEPVGREGMSRRLPEHAKPQVRTPAARAASRARRKGSSGSEMRKVAAAREEKSDGRKFAKEPPVPTGDRITTPQAAATAMESVMRKSGNGGMTELQLAQAIGLGGRGSHNTRQAALRSLVAAKVLAIANESSSDGTPLYTLRASG